MDELLIEQVREHEVIYIHGSPSYRDQHIRQAAWEEIGSELKISANKAKEHWEKLRRCFCNARNRSRDAKKSGKGAKKTSVWKYEQQMSFIIPFLETRKVHSNLQESEAIVNLSAEMEDIADEIEIEATTPRQLDRGHINLETESEGREQDNQVADKGAVLKNAETPEMRYKAVKSLRKKNRSLVDTPAQQIVEILKDNSALRKRKHEEKRTRTQSCNLQESLDEMDMFFLSMSRMTKQLPKLEQSKIKLELSNSVLSAEIKCNEQSLSTTNNPQHSFNTNPTQQQLCVSSTPKIISVEPITLSSEYYIQRHKYSTISGESPTLFEMSTLVSENTSQ